MGKVTKICRKCNKEYRAYLYRNKRFCSKDCAVIEKVTRTCRNCHKEYKAYHDRNLIFCCDKCTRSYQHGENHPNWKPRIYKVCTFCKKEYANNYVGPGSKQLGHGRFFCNMECFKKSKRESEKGIRNPNWKGGKYKNSRGYIMVRHNGGYVPEHRLVMQKEIGRELRPLELVHHINAKKGDNRIENLRIVTHATHSGEIKCPACDYIFSIH